MAARPPALSWALPLLAALAGAGGPQSFELPGAPIDNIEVSGGGVLVAGGSCLYELRPELRFPRRVVPAAAGQGCGEPPGVRSNLLLPYQEAGGTGVLLAGWTQKDGTCQVWEQPGYRLRLNRSEVVSCLPDGSTAGVVFQLAGDWYLAVAATYSAGRYGNHLGCEPSQSDEATVITVRSMANLESKEELGIIKRREEPLHFVDALQWGDHLFFPYYRLKARLGEDTEPPSMAVLRQLRPSEGGLTLQGHVYLDCGCRSLIISSSLVRQGERGWWVGVFRHSHGAKAWNATAICIFGMEEVKEQACASTHFVMNGKACFQKEPSIKKLPTLIHSGLVAVYGTVVLNQIVLFLGTDDGQLLKAILNEDMESNCPEVLYEIEEETSVFPKLRLDPVDNNYIYLSSANKVRRIPVANCSRYVSEQECLSAKDPYCGWCSLNQRCTLKENCTRSNSIKGWYNISHAPDKDLKILLSFPAKNQVAVTASISKILTSCMIKIVTPVEIFYENVVLRNSSCFCNLTSPVITDKDCLVLEASLSSTSWNITQTFWLKNCSRCMHKGECASCKWMPVSPAATCQDSCNAAASKRITTAQKTEHISIHSIEPLWISTLGKSEITVKGENFTHASGIKLILTGITGCKPDIIKVRNVLNDTQMTFTLPPTRKEAKSICIQANGKKCSPPVTLHYVSLPSCFGITPNTSWISGGRKITTIGRNFNVVDSVIISDDQRSNLTVSRSPGNESEYHYLTPSLSHATEGKVVDMMLKVETTFIPCVKLHYHPDPVFINYQLHTELDPDLELKIYKENDKLNISKTEVEVYLSYMNGAQTKKIWFSVQNITKKPDRSTILCKFKREGTDKIDFSTVKVFVKLGNFEHEVKPTSSHIYLYVLILLPIIVCVIIAFIVTRYKSKELTRKQSQQLELLEYEIRKEIREGFAELQMDELDVVDSFGTIPFLDYKHFALRTFFPESGDFASMFSEDMPQSRDQTSKDESFNMLHALICNKNFLVTLIHTLEKQKNFTVKDRCLFASFLTIALQTKLVYLTHILEVLTKDLMEQSSNVQPKLLLRRTESVVEKLLTNWMSVCLSGFLRETIGEPFYLLVTTLNQRINKGPVDAITCKALYTLNEDWLLWQVSEFKTVALNIIFEKIPENESGDACQTIQVNVLDCDTIGQAKEKSLQAFLNKNGFLYGLQLDEIGLELVSEERQRELLDIDGSSEVMEDGIRKLNTISHYEISNGATIKVFKKKANTRSDVDYSDEHCHLILPDCEANKDVKGGGHKGKQKFKVKEMYLTKLLSTKVAIHSVVERLFRSIWTLPNNKAPVAIKYFFDFLDAQAESKKITDPDVVHIWKTNSLPLRFWVNILKNPQFVFDIKKTSHIDGCLSVIAQAFMDAFSLAEQTLGKEAPTNKLLYAKDIPLYKKEVKAYYKAIRDLPPLTTSEVEEFLTQESKKHENEFNEKVALNEICRYIVKYYDEIVSKLERERGFEEVQKQLQQVKALFDEKKKCKWF
ncbi:plexin-C1 isoform X2 [Colius striatus]|uniref:plexin-C1 isoform X2 n=1 Tax=Colius striatus TaxID=57412 RepID=UPI002B1E65BD|nr:plexin-C1 isoform X2 [Colius striatus]